MTSVFAAATVIAFVASLSALVFGEVVVCSVFVEAIRALVGIVEGAVISSLFAVLLLFIEAK